MSGRQVEVEHGTVCSLPDDFLGYFGWPSVARMDDGTLVAVASGYRNGHMCPFGRTVFSKSVDSGRSWTMPRVINDGPLDDRDAGVTSLGGKQLLVTWFTTNRRHDYETNMQKRIASMDSLQRERWLKTVEQITPEDEQEFVGSWGLLSNDAGNTWERLRRFPASTPHGCIRLRNGDLLYFGKEFPASVEINAFLNAPIVAARSSDQGHTWRIVGCIAPEPMCNSNLHEPHVVELPSGRLIGIIRAQSSGECDLTKLGYIPFSMFMSVSDDGGATWSPISDLGFHGSPPHLLHHSSGVLVLTYGYRLDPYGQRFALSHDGGATWDHDWIIRADGPDGDLGYPCTVELGDGSLFTVYYQKPKSKADRCALLWSRWHLPR